MAKYAGVSVATVSRYLNNSPLIAEPSIEKVKQAIEALNYQPSMMARGLLHGNSKTIALAVDYNNTETYGNDFFLRIQYGLEHELTRNGYYLMICHVGSGKAGVALLESIIRENRIDGLVLLSELARKPVLKLLKESELPFIVAGRTSEKDVKWVDIDNIEAGNIAAGRLIKTGASRIGFLTNSFDKKFVKERFKGYKEALKRAHLIFDEKRVSDGLEGPEQIQRFVKQELHHLCDAYVATDSTIAFHFMRELYKYHIRVPDQVQVIGFDDSILAEAADPAMTVVEIDVTQLGISAAKHLINSLQSANEEDEENLLAVKIIERNSTN